ncbi:hypothetical protein BVX95_00285 [archaeon D22]|nr:hypothetical protein BVX95_00285 [archaeon D22]
MKKHDFIQVEYTGKLEDGTIFDTTNEEVAKKSQVHNQKMSYGPITICVGERQIVKGLDDGLVDKEVGKDYTFEIEAENAFGKKDAKLIKLVPTSAFKEQKIQPFVGLEINLDGQYGLIRSVNGGRTLVDFNHPLSGKKVIYEVKTVKKVEDAKEKVDSMLSLTLNISSPKTEVKGDELKINEEIPEPFREVLTGKITEVVKDIKKVSYK